MAQQGQKPVIQPCRYKTGKTLGAGSYSVVKECVHIDTGRYYAAKVINKRLMMGREHMVRNEIAVLKRVSVGHRNILTLVDYFETMNNLYLVTDLALGGELFDRICRKGSYYETDAADLIRATLSAVAYLHDHGIVHRDLKPENLLFRTPEDNADLLIADFGLSRIMDEEQFHVLTTTCGTPGYMAPEIFKKTGHGKPVDIWAIGVITYFLLCGYTPFDRNSGLEEMQAILEADYAFEPAEYWRNVSQTARDFIQACLTVDPKQRMSAHRALQHPWIASDDPMSSEVSSRRESIGEDLLPTVRKNFNARRTLHKAIDTVRAINKLREGGGLMANAVQQMQVQANAQPKSEQVDGSKVMDQQGMPMAGSAHGGGMEGVVHTGGHGGSADTVRPQNHQQQAQQGQQQYQQQQQQQQPQQQSQSQYQQPQSSQPQSQSQAQSQPQSQLWGGGNGAGTGAGAGGTSGGATPMDIDSRGHGHGQTQEQIAQQASRVQNTINNTWDRMRGRG